MAQPPGLAALGVFACPFMCLCLGVVAGDGRSSFLYVSSLEKPNAWQELHKEEQRIL